MLAAYWYGFRRLGALRVGAARGDGPESMILVRSLLSLVARSKYLDAPDDPDERYRRFQQFRAHEIREEIRTVNELAAAGFDVVVDTADLEAQIAEIGPVGAFPNDAQLMKDHVALTPYYARLYRVASGHVHFSLIDAVGRVRGSDAFDLDEPQWDLVEEALHIALVVFGTFLEVSEKSIHHGLTDRAFEIVRAVFAEPAA